MKKQRGADNEGPFTQATDASILLVDRGEHSRELGAVFLALARVRFRDETSFVLEELDDLEALLGERSGTGTLILECGLVPTEDIGFVRRFLERQSAWKLLVLGDDPQDSRARGLLALPRTQWLPWPPDLDQLAALLGGDPAGGNHRAAARAGSAPGGARASGGAAIAVDAFLEELLAGVSLSGAGVPRFLYRCDEPLQLVGDAAPLSEALSGLLHLARVCAGEGQVVNVTAQSGGDEAVEIRIDFPLGPLTDADLPGLFEGPFDGSPELAEGVEAARRGAEGLRASGASVELLAQRPGRLRLEVQLPQSVAARA